MCQLHHQEEDCDDAEHSFSLPHQLCKRFSLAGIKLATHDFNEAFVIGKGGFGKVYKGMIHGHLVAMKRLNCDSRQGASEFWTEISMLSKFRHSHLVSLIGYCKAGQEMILVYEYMPNGTLADHLHKIKSNGSYSSLSWAERLNICIDAARGLDYLHTGTSLRQRVIHRDVKSSNILLDDNLSAKISDFGLSRIGPSNLVDTGTHIYSSLIRGTFGYMDEECFLTRRLTRKSDVYAFGVVLFEVLSGRPAVNPILEEEQRGLAGWARHCTKEGTLINKLMDPSLRGRILPPCLEVFVDIAYKCILKFPKQRPTMAEVVARLEYAISLQQGICTEIPEVIRHQYSSTQQDAVTGNNCDLHHNDVTNRYRPPEGPSHRQQLIGRAKPKSIVRKVWSMFTAKGTTAAIPNDDLCLESSDFNIDTHEDRSIEGLEALRFEHDILSVATDNFSEANKIMQGALSSLYKGKLQNGQGIVVKRFDCYSQQVLEEYKNEVSLLANLKHDNLVQLLGYCREETQLLLVYGLAIYTSLDLLIFDYASRVLLDWNRRYKILLGVALGLRHIHNHAPHQIVHTDIKPANIFLDQSLNPKLSNFGQARNLAISDMSMQIREYLEPKLDVFRFGLLVLEIIRGQRSSENFIYFAWSNWWKGLASNIIDPTLDVDSSIIGRYIQIGLLCAQEDAAERPTMDEVVLMLLSSSSLTLRIPKKLSLVPLSEPSDSDDETGMQALLIEDQNSGTVEDFMEELNLNPR